MWVVGNEWNYGGLYVGLNRNQSIERLNEVIGLIKAADPSRPSRRFMAKCLTDGFSMRCHRWMHGDSRVSGTGFGDVFQRFAALSPKPMYFGEWLDAYNAILNREDQAAQAEATRVLTQLIVNESTVRRYVQRRHHL